ncbi:MAG: glutaredoxin 3 [Alphaproteobacteria bacterium]|nr:glutaredoxin 3 [Alphaproteobacteria bacterium]NDC56222.1 glutaredoxin 3 [Alphaproteobacteria bacterium]NDG04054.1 glutaredoxin 3 [Alphaproteobacteria bacterium]
MPDIIVYSGPHCPYCVKAKNLLTMKGVAFTEYNVKEDTARFEEMLAKSNGRKTIPQIFINGQHIGGCDDLHALHDAGKLDALLT